MEVVVLPEVVAVLVAGWVLVEELLVAVVVGVKIGSVLMSKSGDVSLYSIRKVDSSNVGVAYCIKPVI